MQNKEVENRLTESEKEKIINDFYFGLAITRMEGFEMTEAEEAYLLYCELNQISYEDMIDTIFKVNAWTSINHEKTQRNRKAYEEYIERLGE